MKKIARINKQATQMKGDDFLGKIAECLESYISQKFGFSAVGKILVDLRQELSFQGVPDRLADDVVTFLERMDTFRFGRASLDAASKASMLEAMKGFIRDLDKVRKEQQP
jgi:hypothetical protein